MQELDPCSSTINHFFLPQAGGDSTPGGNLTRSLQEGKELKIISVNRRVMAGIYGKFVKVLKSNLDEHGLRGLPMTFSAGLHELRKPIHHEINKRRGTNIYDRDWDVLILLDCTRVDMLQSLSDEFNMIGEIDSHPTPGTSSAEWMETTFTEEYSDEMQETVHVTANPNSSERLSSHDFRHLEEVWRDGWDSELGTIPAREVTDRAIALHRQLNPCRMIVHYMQPHPPFIANDEIEAVDVKKPGMEKSKMNVRELHEQENYTSNDLWNAHLDNLRYVLKDVELVRSNIDADPLVISADHGQAFGERDVWGHPESTLAESVRLVPWCETVAHDKREYSPEFDVNQSIDSSDQSLEKKLEHLGYK
ncbi:hypothetical protein Harman_00010 [Haloarcula mannanilytica]|uniref:Sulfatase n=1 Tax=Haloarcula mannanilytica TaxID=2509225 RepID=A0A4C2EC53_9EURY|nr:LTA synthase family protein [Haloarcula mannanilytica]GCF12066.1 hypothetical protein Harman_00010 [Haloarcula mannanilytica]